MRTEPDIVYFSRRSSEELRAASAASGWVAEEAHRELAARYAQLAASIGEADEKLNGSVSKPSVPSKLRQRLPLKHLS